MANKAALRNGPSGSATNGTGAAKARQRARLSQEDVPSYSVEEALRVPRAIGDSYAYRPTRPLNVAGAMKMSPGSGSFRALTGAAIAYGLTTGGAFAPEIGITPLGMRIVRPTKPGDDVAATREALLRPKIVGEFLRQYDGAALPPDQIAKNVLLEKGVPSERADDVLTLIVEGADAVGLLKDIGGKRYVDLAGADVLNSQDLTPSPQPVPPPIGEQKLPVPPAPPSAVSVGPGVHINIEIHIAADATSDTIEEIFRNMRRYVLSSDGSVT